MRAGQLRRRKGWGEATHVGEKLAGAKHEDVELLEGVGREERRLRGGGADKVFVVPMSVWALRGQRSVALEVVLRCSLLSGSKYKRILCSCRLY